MGKIDSLTDLESAFATWRQSKQHPTEAIPDALIERAQKAVTVHGKRAVLGVTRLEWSRLQNRNVGKAKKQASAAKPTFSRLELAAPASSEGRPLAEIETPDGIKLRVFAETPEILHLLSTVMSVGSPR